MHAGVSLRGFARVGSALSNFELVRLGSLSACSVTSSVLVGSPLSLRAFVRVGVHLSVVDTFSSGSFQSESSELINSFGGPKMGSMDLMNVENEFHSG